MIRALASDFTLTTIHSIISYIPSAASGGAHTPQCEARPVQAHYPVPAGAREYVRVLLPGPARSIAALDARSSGPFLGGRSGIHVSTYARIGRRTFCVMCECEKPRSYAHRAGGSRHPKSKMPQFELAPASPGRSRCTSVRLKLNSAHVWSAAAAARLYQATRF